MRCVLLEEWVFLIRFKKNIYHSFTTQGEQRKDGGIFFQLGWAPGSWHSFRECKNWRTSMIMRYRVKTMKNYWNNSIWYKCSVFNRYLVEIWPWYLQKMIKITLNPQAPGPITSENRWWLLRGQDIPIFLGDNCYFWLRRMTRAIILFNLAFRPGAAEVDIVHRSSR